MAEVCAMVEIILRLLSLKVYALVWLFLAFAEYLDWHGRMEVLEVKHPQVAKVVQSRPLRLVLLLMLLGMLIGDLRETMKQMDTEPFVIKLSIPSVDEGARNEQIANLKAKVAPIESRNSLRKQIWRLAHEMDEFYAARLQEIPTQEERATQGPEKVQAHLQAFWQETERQCRQKFQRTLYRSGSTITSCGSQYPH
jgi:hypothetical protein